MREDEGSGTVAAAGGAGDRSGLVIFDCDGVLVDSEVIYVDAELAALARAGLTFDRAAYMRTFMGLSPEEWRRRLGTLAVERTGRQLPDGFFAGLDREIVAAFATSLTALPGAHAAVSALDVPRCVASSTPLAQLADKLDHTGLLDLFDPHVFSAQMVARGKPAPDLFLHAARTMGVAPGRCVVVEDSGNGVRAGVAAGMAVVGVVAGGHCVDGHGDILLACGADTVIDDLTDLAAALARVAPRGRGDRSGAPGRRPWWSGA